MSIAIGGNSVSKMYVGSTEITKAYIGDTLVYGSSEPPVVKDYLKFTALESGTFTLTIDAYVTSEILQSVSYSVDNGATWVTTNNSSSAVTITTPTVQAGGSVLWKGLGISTAYAYADNGKSTFSSTGTFNVSGNIMSLLYGDNFENYTAFDSSANGVNQLFLNCTTLVDASGLELPTGLVERCFYRMFRGCTALVTPPSELPATVLADYCYYHMFYGCTSLTTAPELPATTLAGACYYQMFYGCTALTIAPALPATTLAQRCYYYMFRGCSSLTSAPELPAETLASYGYTGMFFGTGITTAPTLPALTLINYGYNVMFNGCSSLNYIKAMFTNEPSGTMTASWVKDVAATGIFVKNIDATWTTTGTGGVPTGWTVIYYDIDEDKYYLDQQKTTECDDHGNALQYYYIYRTSSNIIERKSTFKNPTINFPAIAGNSYGGVFTDYGGKGTVAAALANNDPVTFTNNIAQDDGTPYVGESNATGATYLFDSSTQITSGITSYTPTIGSIYYIKENPSYILQRYFHPYPTTGTFSNFYAISDIDSMVYSSINCLMKEEGAQNYDTITLNAARSIKIGNVTMTAYRVFKTSGVPSSTIAWLTYSDIYSRLAANKVYIFKMNAVGIDGVTIESTHKWKLTVTSLTRDGVSVEELPNDD